MSEKAEFRVGREFNIICVTNRNFCKEDFFARIEKIAMANVFAIILREKDLSPNDYAKMAYKVLNICKPYDTKIILHNFTDSAANLKAKNLHLPLAKLREMTPSQKSNFNKIGASCHSVDDAKEAESLGASYITAGHIFDTDSKKNIPGRGISFLQKVCAAVSIPVYAIGGIKPSHLTELKNAGAAGCSVMGDFMKCEDVAEYMKSWQKFF